MAVRIVVCHRKSYTPSYHSASVTHAWLLKAQLPPIPPAIVSRRSLSRASLNPIQSSRTRPTFTTPIQPFNLHQHLLEHQGLPRVRAPLILRVGRFIPSRGKSTHSTARSSTHLHSPRTTPHNSPAQPSFPLRLAQPLKPPHASALNAPSAPRQPQRDAATAERYAS